MTTLHRFRATWFAILTLTLLAMRAFAQVPQGTTFTGRLVDDLGAPLAGPVNLELRIYDAETAGAQLYSESHRNVALDAAGGFSVQLGLGTHASGPFDATLFSDVDRWLEVMVDDEVLTPRQIIASVPWALVAQQANEIVPDPNAPRFEDCGDGTIADHETGLLWEKKTGTVGTGVICEAAGCPDPHDVNNLYAWSNTWTAPDGNAYTDFLARLNGDPTVVDATTSEAIGDPAADPTVCFAHYCDWRLPAIGELRTIVVGVNAPPGQSMTCSSAPCMDPDFAAIGGPTASSAYWSASSYTGNPPSVFLATFLSGGVIAELKTADLYVRAVRAGSCN